MISDWLSGNIDLIDHDRAVLDVACGRGRHALWLAAAGFRVVAVDRDVATLSELQQQASAAGADLEILRADLEAPCVDLGTGTYGTVLVFNYLHRPLLPVLIRALGPQGVLLYETFTRGQARRGHPKNPLFLLDDGELPRLVAPLEILRAREGEYGGKLISSVAARKP